MTNDLSKYKNSEASVSRLRRDLGTLESYAALIGILIGAGIFQVTSQAWALTGPSVILGYILLMPAILATSVPYAAFLSTPLGREPGGEYLHISRTLGGYRLSYIGAWLKIISYVGAGAYLANALAGYLIAFSRGSLNQERFRLPLAEDTGAARANSARPVCSAGVKLHSVCDPRPQRICRQFTSALFRLRRIRVVGPNGGRN